MWQTDFLLELRSKKIRYFTDHLHNVSQIYANFDNTSASSKTFSSFSLEIAYSKHAKNRFAFRIFSSERNTTEKKLSTRWIVRKNNFNPKNSIISWGFWKKKEDYKW